MSHSEKKQVHISVSVQHQPDGLYLLKSDTSNQSGEVQSIDDILEMIEAPTFAHSDQCIWQPGLEPTPTIWGSSPGLRATDPPNLPHRSISRPSWKCFQFFPRVPEETDQRYVEPLG
jgi:hypothetical protein